MSTEFENWWEIQLQSMDLHLYGIRNDFKKDALFMKVVKGLSQEAFEAGRLNQSKLVELKPVSAVYIGPDEVFGGDIKIVAPTHLNDPDPKLSNINRSLL